MDIDRDKIEVSNDNEFLQLLMEKHNINAKQLAGWIGRTPITIYKYLSGELTIPSVVWRAIFDHTLDITVFNIVKGELPCVISPLAALMNPPDAATLKEIIDTRKKHHKHEDYILQILQDGIVDASDSAAIAKYKEIFPLAVAAESQLFQVILREYPRIGAKK